MNKNIHVKVEVSGKHLHLSKRDVEKLFGKNYKLKKKSDISQTGQFATRETLTIVGKKTKFEKVRIVGPERTHSQIELSATDCYRLGIKPIYRVSGNTKDAPRLTVQGSKGNTRIPAIVALRHIHISDQEAKQKGLKNHQQVKVRVKGKRSLVFEKVVVRTHPSFVFRLHLDTDEANAAGVKQGSSAEILF